MKCIGLLENIAKISKTQNVPEFEEETLKDKRDSCVLILSIRTRENRDIKKFISLGCFAMAGICAVAYVGSEIYFRRKE